MNNQTPSFIKLAAPTDPLLTVANTTVPGDGSVKNAIDLANYNHQTEYLWKVHSYIHEYIRFSDTKVSLASTVFLATGVIFFKAIQGRVLSNIEVATVILFVLAATGGFLSLIPRLWSIVPRGFVFWESILKYKGPSEFSAAVNSADENKFQAELCYQIYYVSKVCSEKYFWAKICLWSGFLGALLASYVLWKN